MVDGMPSGCVFRLLLPPKTHAVSNGFFSRLFPQILITVGPQPSDDDDYDIDFYTVDPGDEESMDPGKPSPRDQLEVCLMSVLMVKWMFNNLCIISFWWVFSIGVTCCRLTSHPGIL
jgi:hypothetical protein